MASLSSLLLINIKLHKTDVADVHDMSAALVICIKYCGLCLILTLKVVVTTIDAQWEGMGDVGPARYEPALLPPCPTITSFK